jgi:hypothetical protein
MRTKEGPQHAVAKLVVKRGMIPCSEAMGLGTLLPCGTYLQYQYIVGFKFGGIKHVKETVAAVD